MKLDAFAFVKSYFIFLFVKSNTEPSSIFLCNQYFYRSLHVYFLFNVKPLKFYFCLIYTLETQKTYKNWRRGVSPPPKHIFEIHFFVSVQGTAKCVYRVLFAGLGKINELVKIIKKKEKSGLFMFNFSCFPKITRNHPPREGGNS